MFLANLPVEKQEAFLNLAYTMVYADGRLDAAEKKLFDSYKLEIDVDFSKAHAVDFAEELAAFDDSSVTEKTGVFFELYAIALIDEAYPDEEKVLVDIMQKRFGITDAKMQEMRDGLKTLTDAYKNLAKIVES
ncbi:MAG: hypothetical protein IJL12_01920 [Selenomonadaceae bacterium]|nr:hypothetical protein [Selenomonadaceae bacterium]MBQ6131085.1 hypothetical protein [Selenomonadaceae bacterium]